MLYTMIPSFNNASSVVSLHLKAPNIWYVGTNTKEEMILVAADRSVILTTKFYTKIANSNYLKLMKHKEILK